jgi:VanZ family protein
LSKGLRRGRGFAGVKLVFSSISTESQVKPMRWRVDSSTVLLMLWALFIVYGTLIPFRFTKDLGEVAARLHLLGDPLNRPVSRSDVVSNVLLFVPWGALYTFRRAQRRRFWTALLGATFSGMALSGLVEICQLFAPSRTTSLVDLATNTTGAALGALAGWGFGRRVWPTWSGRLTRVVEERPTAACALAAAAGLLLAGLSPFDVSIDLGDLRAAVKQARPIPFGPSLGGAPPLAEPWSWAQEGLSAVLTGALFALALREAGEGGVRAVAATAALGGALAFAIEVAQLTIPGRAADMTSVVLAVIGSATGGALVTWFPQRTPRQWVSPALVVWSLAVVLAAWTPPHLAAPEDWSLQAWQLVPFWSYYRRTDVYAVADLFNQVMSFIPLGVLLAARAPRLPVWRALVVGLSLGAVLEVGQLGLAERTAEVTDALSAGAGALLGALLWQRAVAIRTASAGHARYRIASSRSR